MELSQSEIDALFEHDTTGRAKPESISVAAVAGSTREQIMAEMVEFQKAISAGNFVSVKSVDHGTYSYRGTYRSLRDIGWGWFKAFRVAVYRKVCNVMKTRKF